MKTYKCKLAGVNNAPIYELTYYELANMSIQYPMFVLINGLWKGIIHTRNGMVA
jgi:hypothetical protein